MRTRKLWTSVWGVLFLAVLIRMATAQAGEPMSYRVVKNRIFTGDYLGAYGMYAVITLEFTSYPHLDRLYAGSFTSSNGTQVHGFKFLEKSPQRAVAELSLMLLPSAQEDLKSIQFRLRSHKEWLSLASTDVEGQAGASGEAGAKAKGAAKPKFPSQLKPMNTLKPATREAPATGIKIVDEEVAKSFLGTVGRYVVITFEFTAYPHLENLSRDTWEASEGVEISGFRLMLEEEGETARRGKLWMLLMTSAQEDVSKIRFRLKGQPGWMKLQTLTQTDVVPPKKPKKEKPAEKAE